MARRHELAYRGKEALARAPNLHVGIEPEQSHISQQLISSLSVRVVCGHLR